MRAPLDRVSRATVRAFLRVARELQVAGDSIRLVRIPTFEELVTRHGRGAIVVPATPRALQRECFPGVAFPPALEGATSFCAADVRAVVRHASRTHEGGGSALLQLSALNRLRALAPQHTLSMHEGPIGVRLMLEVSTAPLSSLPEHLLAAAEHWRHGYLIRVTNTGTTSVQLLSRHWTFTDARGSVTLVPYGSPGVVGLTPHIPPGSAFEYVSSVNLATPTGDMKGGFVMAVDKTGAQIDARVAITELDAHAGSS